MATACIVDNSTVKLLWDLSLVCASHHSSNQQPDIVLFDHPKENILFIKVTCPADSHVLSKENEKLHKHCVLAHEIYLMYQMSVKIIMVVIGQSGVISSQCKTFLQSILGYYDSPLCHLLKAAVIHTLQTTNYELYHDATVNLLYYCVCVFKVHE